MRLPRTLAALAASFATAALAAAAATTTTITLSIPATPQLPNPGALSPATRATLTDASQPDPAHRRRVALLTTTTTTTTTTGDASFVFHDVPAGSYLADVHGAGYAFAPLRVDVVPRMSGGGGGSEKGEQEDRLAPRAWETFRGNEWDNRGPEVRPLSPGAGFPVRPVAQKVFYAERGSFSVFGILKNPMIIMGIVSMGLFIGMPKLMENMDPEMRAEFEKQQQSNPMASLMGGGGGGAGSGGPDMDVAGFLSGHSSKKDEAGPEAPSSGGGGGSGKKGGRR